MESGLAESPVNTALILSLTAEVATDGADIDTPPVAGFLARKIAKRQ